MKFIHAADLHLDSPPRNLERYEGAPIETARGATRCALENLVTLALQESVDLVVIAGDLYDGDWHDYHTGLFFNQQMSKLRAANIQVVLLSGNHDAASAITKTLRTAKQLSNVQHLSDKQPKTVKLKCSGLDVAIHGQGFARKQITDNLALNYPQALDGYFNIGLLHTSLTGYPRHDMYAPCSLDDLKSKGYDYWALGHIHKRNILCKSPWIAFSGNTQGRDIGETGPKGCLLVTVEPANINVQFKPLDVLRWRRCCIDATDAIDAEDVLDRVKAGLLITSNNYSINNYDSEINTRASNKFTWSPEFPLEPKSINNESIWEGPEAIRLEIKGSCQAHTELKRNYSKWINELRAQATNLSNGRLWLEKIQLDTRSTISLDDATTQHDGIGLLIQTAQKLQLADPALQRLLKERNTLQQKLPYELQNEFWLQIEDANVFKRLKDEVVQLLLPYL